MGVLRGPGGGFGGSWGVLGVLGGIWGSWVSWGGPTELPGRCGAFVRRCGAAPHLPRGLRGSRVPPAAPATNVRRSWGLPSGLWGARVPLWGGPTRRWVPHGAAVGLPWGCRGAPSGRRGAAPHIAPSSPRRRAGLPGGDGDRSRRPPRGGAVGAARRRRVPLLVSTRRRGEPQRRRLLRGGPHPQEPLRRRCGAG